MLFIEVDTRVYILSHLTWYQKKSYTMLLLEIGNAQQYDLGYSILFQITTDGQRGSEYIFVITGYPENQAKILFGVHL